MLSPYFLYAITPLLGLLRNYVKYKSLYLRTFIRTPIVYFYIHLLLVMRQSNHIIFKTLIFERWFWFVFKTYQSIANNYYQRKKDKYQIKYNMVY